MGAILLGAISGGGASHHSDVLRGDISAAAASNGGQKYSSPLLCNASALFLLFLFLAERLCRRKCQQLQMVDKVVYPGFSQNDS